MKADTVFLGLSRALTGEQNLDARIAGELERRLRTHYATELQSLLDAFRTACTGTKPELAAREALDSSEKHHKVAREVIRVWYTGQFETPFEGIDSPKTPEQWESGLLWRILQAPAPAFSKNNYGVWATKPNA